MHTPIGVSTNGIIVYLTTDKIGDNATFRMLTYIALTKAMSLILSTLIQPTRPKRTGRTL